MIDDLRACIEFAVESGCQWLCFDRDGLVMKELPMYEW